MDRKKEQLEAIKNLSKAFAWSCEECIIDGSELSCNDFFCGCPADWEEEIEALKESYGGDEMKEVNVGVELMYKGYEEGDLKKCPFCGGEARLSEREYIKSKWVQCTVCGAQGKEFEYQDGAVNKAEELAIKAWNLRK